MSPRHQIASGCSLSTASSTASRAWRFEWMSETTATRMGREPTGVVESAHAREAADVAAPDPRGARGRLVGGRLLPLGVEGAFGALAAASRPARVLQLPRPEADRGLREL